MKKLLDSVEVEMTDEEIAELEAQRAIFIETGSRERVSSPVRTSASCSRLAR
ncbi:hypothetical protein [Rhizobium sp. BK251]|uniref:hypothetical protein n=1 Tax=Rhizobium sp. BK251 TaxID=2512125 RepID=UPI001FDFBD45|nr:hypothetical protein [Rhizobium sp. BK251]